VKGDIFKKIILTIFSNEEVPVVGRETKDGRLLLADKTSACAASHAAIITPRSLHSLFFRISVEYVYGIAASSPLKEFCWGANIRPPGGSKSTEHSLKVFEETCPSSLKVARRGCVRGCDREQSLANYW
jgi:hypothetical protein